MRIIIIVFLCCLILLSLISCNGSVVKDIPGGIVEDNPNGIDSLKADPSLEYDKLRQKWEDFIDGGPNLDLTDKDIADKVAGLSKAGQTYWDSMNKSAERTSLWSDLSDGKTKSATVSNSFARLRSMALAYATAGSKLHENAALKDDIISGMDWLTSNWYSGSGREYDNWWDWDIGSPLRIKDIIVLMYNQMTTEQINKYIAAMDHYGPGISSSAFDKETGANRSDILTWNLICGILQKDTVRLFNVRDEMSPLFDYVTSGDGFYTDGSFIQHTKIAYNGTYGQVLLNGVANIMYMLSGSSWDVRDLDKKNTYNWVYDSFEPIVYKGLAMDMFRGRAISREKEPDSNTGYAIIGGITKLAFGSEAQDSEKYKSMVKYWLQHDTSGRIYASLQLGEVLLLKNIMKDSSVTPREELIKHYEMTNIDRSIHLAPGFGFGISKSSQRIARFELMNGENQKAWYTGDGMTYLYNNDLKQYSDDFWATVNYYRLPGTTVDTRPRMSGSQQYGDGEVVNNSSQVSGGTVLGQYGVSGLNLFAYGSSLVAKKSWFMFDNEVVALGAGITSADDRNIETIVEQRKLNAKGNNTFTVDGTVKPNSLGWSETMNGVNWAHLTGNVTGSDIGYYFPYSATVKGMSETRTGSWSEVNLGGAKDARKRNYLSLWFDHGIKPKDDTYSYVLLPGMSSSLVSSYASKPDITILENSSEAQTVKENKLNITGAFFWTDSLKTTGIISCDKKASVIMKEEADGSLEVAVSDLAFKNDGSINIEINRLASGTLSIDSGVTVTQLSPTIKFSVNVKGAKGKTFNVKFK